VLGAVEIKENFHKKFWQWAGNARPKTSYQLVSLFDESELISPNKSEASQVSDALDVLQ
jgi:hypothetical protein